MTTSEWEDAMKQYFRLLNKGKLEEEDEETALTAFDGACFNCGNRESREGLQNQDPMQEFQWELS